VTDTDVTRYPGVHTRADSNIYQFGLKPPTDVRHHFRGYWAVRCSLKTADLRQANAKAAGLHAEWIARFDQLERADNPVHADLTPALLAVIAAEIRRWILQADENMRAIPEDYSCWSLSGCFVPDLTSSTRAAAPGLIH